MEFVCPSCKKNLKRSKNSFVCEEHGVFQVIDNIPVFSEININENSKYFQKHWQDVEIEKYPKSKIKVADFFLNSPSINFNKSKVLDAGCGDGVHLYYLDQKFNDVKLYGVDISMPALFKTKHKVERSSLSCSSVDALPFESGFFDISFSYGVLAYTFNPKESFEEVCRVTKKGGYIGVWFYPKPNIIANILLKTVRYIGSLTNGIFMNLIANIIVPFLYILPVASKVNLSNATWSDCREIVLVNIAPKHLWYPKETEIIELFNNNGLEIIKIEKNNKITIWGVKK